MPNAHGFTVLRAVSDGTIPRPHFVAAISEWSDSDNRRIEDGNYNIDAVITKPFNFNEIQAAMSDLANSTFEDNLLDGLIA
jgi:DNA-binding response OmpR family regulator